MPKQKESRKPQQQQNNEKELSSTTLFKVPTSAGIKKRTKKPAQNNTPKPKKESTESDTNNNTTTNTNTTKDSHNNQLEESESEFSFEESGEDISHESSDLSSSATDEFASGALAIALDKQTHTKLITEVEKKKKKITEIKHTDPRGVIYVGHIPFGFFELQMKKFFSQFGVVTRLKLSRNKKTGHSKHYAFIEFLDSVVAKIVAETMNGYIMYSHVLDCHVVPPEKVHPNMFYSINLKKLKKRQQLRNIEKPDQNQEQLKSSNKRNRVDEKKRRQKLQKLGINYDFPAIKLLEMNVTETKTNSIVPQHEVNSSTTTDSI